jgi:DNA polymerase bacteriophage-type
MKTSFRFQVADLAAIETRVGSWLAECKDLNDVFVPYTDQFGKFQSLGKDPYIAFAVKMYGGNYDTLYADFKGVNGKERKGEAKRKRQISKPGVLGAIYRLSGGELIYVFKCVDCNHVHTGKSSEDWPCPKCDAGDPIDLQFTKKTGLWAYADAMGIEMSQEQAHEIVRIFRDSYPEICNADKNKGPLGIWKRLEEAVADVMHPDHPQTVRYIGPNNAVKIDRINLVGRHPIMRMRLPSGRYLHYIDAHLAPTKMTWTQLDEDGEEVPVYKDALIYAGTNQKTKRWENNIHTHGGKLFENLVQAIARDILGVKLLDFEAADMPVIGHVHDEGICLVVDDLLSGTVEDMVEIMSKSVSWAPGLLLGADGYEEAYYHK